MTSSGDQTGRKAMNETVCQVSQFFRLTANWTMKAFNSQHGQHAIHLRSRSRTLLSNVRDGARSLSSAICANALSIPA
jgi:hypothetical protein